MIQDNLKIMVGVNTLTSVDRLTYASHCQFWYKLGKEFPNFQFGFNTPNRSSIDRMRNYTARVALDQGFDYLLFIDDDVTIPFNYIKPNGDGTSTVEKINPLKRLLECDADIAAGWTIIRGYPFNNMFFKYDDQKNLLFYNKFEVDDNGVLPVDAVGFSMALIKCDLLRKVAPPYFITGPRNTEDIYFCVKAKQAVPDVKIVVDTHIKTGHILGSELITPENREIYKEYIEKAEPDLLPREEKFIGARGNDYLQMVENPTEENIKAFYETPVGM